MRKNRLTRHVHLTRQGRIALILTLFLLLIAWNTGIYLYYLSLSALVSTLLVSYGFGHRTLRGLQVEVITPQGVYRGTPFPVTVRLCNTRRFLPCSYVRVRAAQGTTSGEIVVPMLAPRSEISARFDLRLDRRGVYPFPRIQLVSAAPFGFLTVSKETQPAGEIAVYPRVRPLKTVAFNEIQRLGNVPRKTLGDGGDFFSLREYLPGDDLRLVAWRASARTNTLVVRELSAESSRETVLVLDTRRGDFADFDTEFENAIELAASLACTLLNRQFRVGFFAPDVFLSLDHGSSQLTKLLDALARLQPTASNLTDPFHASLQRDWTPGIRFLFISPDPNRWAQSLGGGSYVLDPREVIYA